MDNEAEIRQAIHLIWRNLPGFPTTFGPCSRKCGAGSGRGGGPCLECAKKDLGKLVGADVAEQYVQSVRAVRDIESKMLKQ